MAGSDQETGLGNRGVTVGPAGVQVHVTGDLRVPEPSDTGGSILRALGLLVLIRDRKNAARVRVGDDSLLGQLIVILLRLIDGQGKPRMIDLRDSRSRHLRGTEVSIHGLIVMGSCESVLG